VRRARAMDSRLGNGEMFGTTVQRISKLTKKPSNLLGFLPILPDHIQTICTSGCSTITTFRHAAGLSRANNKQRRLAPRRSAFAQAGQR
jgi:hypothetical protein